MTTIYIPSSVKTISKCAFEGIDNLTIYCEMSSKPSGWDNAWDNTRNGYEKHKVVWGA